MEEMNLPSTKTIIKRVLLLMVLVCSIVLLITGIRYYRRNVSWKGIFNLTYLGVETDRQGYSIGGSYQIYNNTNNVYDIDCIYLEVSDAHRTYTIPYEVYITLQPHSEKTELFRYTEIGDYFGADKYLCEFVIKGFDYEKR